MAKRTTTSRRSTQNSNKGLTIVELLVAAAIGLVILGIGFTLTVSSRNLVQADQDRTDANQNLRGAMELIGTDVRLAGERLTSQGAPAIAGIEIKNGNELIVRRNIFSDALPVCRDSSWSTGQVYVSLTGLFWSLINQYPACKNEPRDKTTTNSTGSTTTSNGTNMPDDLERWKAYREAQVAAGNAVRAYIYSPASKLGEFFNYSGEDRGQTLLPGWTLVRSGGGAWQRVYRVSEASSVYMLDERRYVLEGGVLKVIVNGGNSPLRIANNVGKLEFKGVRADGTKVTTVGADWQTLSAVEVSLEVDGRVLTSQFFPRNILSN